MEMGIFFMILWGIGIAIPIALLINIFIMFSNIKNIKELLIEQNENIETLIKLAIENNDKQN